jgi:putative membrane protein
MQDMKKVFCYCAFIALSVICFSCNSGQSDSAKDAKDSNAVKMDSSGTTDHATATVPASVSKDDAGFAVNAAQGGMMEVQLGQLAGQQASAQDVKDFGAMMVRDHSKGGDKLKAIAASKNLTLPDSLSPDMQKEMTDLQNKSGKDFDKAYISMMVDDHKKDIKEFENEAKNGSDADIRGFADSSLHMLNMHLDAAEKCHKMEKKM